MRMMAVTVIGLAAAGCGARHHADPVPVPAPSASVTVNGAKTLRDTWTYGDGVSVSLAGFGRGKSGESGSPPDAEYVSFFVSVANSSGQSVDLEWMTADCTAGGRPAERVFDDGLDLPNGHLLPGKSYRIKAACAVPAAVHEIQVEVSPDFGHNDAVFTGPVS